MVASLVQNASGSSSSASPASVTVSPAATGAGNLLILFVSCTASSGAAIATPANWTLVASNSDGNVAAAVFIYQNNPGGISSVVISVTATGGGGAAALLTEWSGCGISPNVEFSNFVAGNLNAWTQLFTSPPTHINELMIFAICRQAASSTPVNSAEFGSSTFVQSTGATLVNINITSFNGLSQITISPSSTGSFGATVHFCVIGIRLHTLGEALKTLTNQGGTDGLWLVG